VTARERALITALATRYSVDRRRTARCSMPHTRPPWARRASYFRTTTTRRSSVRRSG